MAEDIQFGVKRRRAHHGLGDAPDLCTPEAERGTFLRYNPNPNLTLTLKPYANRLNLGRGLWQDMARVRRWRCFTHPIAQYKQSK